jgi:hypothetical protein
MPETSWFGEVLVWRLLDVEHYAIAASSPGHSNNSTTSSPQTHQIQVTGQSQQSWISQSLRHRGAKHFQLSCLSYCQDAILEVLCSWQLGLQRCHLQDGQKETEPRNPYTQETDETQG